MKAHRECITPFGFTVYHVYLCFCVCNVHSILLASGFTNSTPKTAKLNSSCLNSWPFFMLAWSCHCRHCCRWPRCLFSGNSKHLLQLCQSSDGCIFLGLLLGLARFPCLEDVMKTFTTKIHFALKRRRFWTVHSAIFKITFLNWSFQTKKYWSTLVEECLGAFPISPIDQTIHQVLLQISLNDPLMECLMPSDGAILRASSATSSCVLLQPKATALVSAPCRLLKETSKNKLHFFLRVHKQQKERYITSETPLLHQTCCWSMLVLTNQDLISNMSSSQTVYGADGGCESSFSIAQNGPVTKHIFRGISSYCKIYAHELLVNWHKCFLWIVHCELSASNKFRSGCCSGIQASMRRIMIMMMTTQKKRTKKEKKKKKSNVERWVFMLLKSPSSCNRESSETWLVSSGKIWTLPSVRTCEISWTCGQIWFNSRQRFQRIKSQKTRKPWDTKWKHPGNVLSQVVFCQDWTLPLWKD